ncbi:MAG: acyltransferase [Mesorhizobium sp.]|nr:acyltransferase [Mesorhizobium sp.]RWP48642.1 MAG: acyltransferase [Mesorhizobium sp.]
MTQKYRPEIDGLRAIAVISVILFHAGFTTVPGGFVGVDIFFVISGYLITQILSGHPFSILQFYERRIRRTLPALMVMMLIVMAPGYALMLPDDLENLGQSLVATTLFANNILLLMTSGYFAEGVEFKPLMHTWSL